ncbi:hypothetical protein BDN71DRAFT_949691 [Pleurotus eryngii]|uniref:TEA domain-containing protein n=1 Tax=Pleurotus eryngii TaxID=5323 RepID=A0A9P6DDK5_PLEER|nr:hypothetical protein BDN71DRAFT_949691 [Pleurotus eryngii]
MITPPAVSFKRPEAGPSKTLTPQRKHRKLLKDGSGTEVWPERIEKVFVQGLREYWHSPFATYSRGRSRYRNQFLVEHLAKAGITRSKKQVASHIQVLRNMWKGEPEFHLVAGGEELADSSPLPPTKQDERAVDHHGLWSFDWNEFLDRPHLRLYLRKTLHLIRYPLSWIFSTNYPMVTRICKPLRRMPSHPSLTTLTTHLAPTTSRIELPPFT